MYNFSLVLRFFFRPFTVQINSPHQRAPRKIYGAAHFRFSELRLVEVVGVFDVQSARFPFLFSAHLARQHGKPNACVELGKVVVVAIKNNMH